MHRKPYFIAINGMITFNHNAPEDCAYGQDIFETMIHFLNHGR